MYEAIPLTNPEPLPQSGSGDEALLVKAELQHAPMDNDSGDSVERHLAILISKTDNDSDRRLTRTFASTIASAGHEFVYASDVQSLLKQLEQAASEFNPHHTFMVLDCTAGFESEFELQSEKRVLDDWVKQMNCEFVVSVTSNSDRARVESLAKVLLAEHADVHRTAVRAFAMLLGMLSPVQRMDVDYEDIKIALGDGHDSLRLVSAAWRIGQHTLDVPPQDKGALSLCNAALVSIQGTHTVNERAQVLQAVRQNLGDDATLIGLIPDGLYYPVLNVCAPIRIDVLHR